MGIRNETFRGTFHFTSLDCEMLRICIKETDYDGAWPEKYNKAIIPYSLFSETIAYASYKNIIISKLIFCEIIFKFNNLKM